MLNTVTSAYRSTILAASFLFWSLSLFPQLLFAQDYQLADSSAVKVRLIAAEDGAAPSANTVLLGLDVVLEDGWKTYWRSPGAIGLPPEIDWAGSENVADIQLLFPAPQRFTAFEIENFGYVDRIVFPIQATLENPGQAATFNTRLTLLVCGNVCIPQDFDLTLTLPAASGINSENTDLIASYLERIPDVAEDSDIRITSATLNSDFLTVTVQSPSQFSAPDFFPELGPSYTFGKPDIRIDETRMNLWAQLPLLSGDPNVPTLRLTMTDGDRAVTLDTGLSDQPAPEPFGMPIVARGDPDVMTLIGLACLAGLVLLVMLGASGKFTSVMPSKGRTSTIARTGLFAVSIAALALIATLMFVG